MSSPRVIDGLSALKGEVGQSLGQSDWLEIDQSRIDGFAAVTGDDQWIHVDVDRARRDSPYGAPVAHGFLTLSLLPYLIGQAYRVEGVRGKVNYGLNKVRFPTPVTVGSAVRADFRLLSVESLAGGRALVTTEATVEARGQGKPACVAEMLAMILE